MPYDQAVRSRLTRLPKLVTLAMMVLAISSSRLGHAAPSDNPPLPQGPLVSIEAPGLEHSLTKALSYQAVVVTTDQLLYFLIITGTTASEVGFLAANALTGVIYYAGFEEAWRAASPGPTQPNDDVSFAKAIAYRVFDTVRVLGITLAIGTPISGSLVVTGAIAATRTGIYMLHEYAWAWASSSPPEVTRVSKRGVGTTLR